MYTPIIANKKINSYCILFLNKQTYFMHTKGANVGSDVQSSPRDTHIYIRLHFFIFVYTTIFQKLSILQKQTEGLHAHRVLYVFQSLLTYLSLTININLIVNLFCFKNHTDYFYMPFVSGARPVLILFVS